MLLSLVTLDSEGRKAVASTAAATQAATTAQRKRTANRPAAAKKLVIVMISGWVGLPAGRGPAAAAPS